MSGERFRPCEISEATDVISWLNEPTTDIARRRELPLSAVLANVRVHTEALAVRLEAGVYVSGDEEREVVRRLYLQTRRQLEALAVAVGLLTVER
jgi:hypothetical protein